MAQNDAGSCRGVSLGLAVDGVVLELVVGNLDLDEEEVLDIFWGCPELLVVACRRRRRGEEER